MELLRDTEPGPTGGGTVGSGGEEVPRPRMSPATIAAKVSVLLPRPGPAFTSGRQCQDARSCSSGPALATLMQPPGIPKEGGNGAWKKSAIFPTLPQHGEEVSPAASDLAMVLTRGLSLEHQKSSRDSLQYSSGYSTQTTTPSCSEDTIPSQGEPRGNPTG